MQSFLANHLKNSLKLVDHPKPFSTVSSLYLYLHCWEPALCGPALSPKLDHVCLHQRLDEFAVLSISTASFQFLRTFSWVLLGCRRLEKCEIWFGDFKRKLS